MQALLCPKYICLQGDVFLKFLGAWPAHREMLSKSSMLTGLTGVQPN